MIIALSPENRSGLLSPPGLLLAALGGLALQAPFLSLAANRIVAGEGFNAWELTEASLAIPGLLAVVAGLLLGLPSRWHWLRLSGAVLGLAGLMWLLSSGASALLADAGDYARVSPGAGFWCLLVVLCLLMADALAQLSPGPASRLTLLLLMLLALACLLYSGMLSQLSILQEYASRQDALVSAAWQHLGLTLGSLTAATLVGLPLGICLYRRASLRKAILPILSFLQTIPSLAMFGIMIPLLSGFVSIVPAAGHIGIAGVGFAPAFLALLLYSLLPVTGNVVAGLQSTPAAAIEAARAMGMSARQRLFRVELRLGLPMILTGLRVALVQTIGLAVIAGLIGGGGFGTFVFQGLNQTATDLILLGALPTVALALSAAVAMDVVIESSRTPGQGRHD